MGRSRLRHRRSGPAPPQLLPRDHLHRSAHSEAGYTGLSRGRESNWLVLTRTELDQIDAELANHNTGIPLPGEEPDDIATELTRRLERSRAKLLALTRDPHADHVSHLADTLGLTDLEATARRCRAVEAEATRIVGCDPRVVADEVARAQHTATHLAIGQRVKAYDRNNIGTIAAYDDRSGTLTVHFVAANGNEADRELGWGDVEIVNPRQPDPRELPADAQATLDALLEPVREAVAAWHAHLADNGIGPLDAQHHERAATLTVDRGTRRLVGDRPDWLHQLLDDRPDSPMAATVWDDATREIATHRLRHDLTNDIDGIGPSPSLDEPVYAAWSRVSSHIARSRTWLSTHHDQPLMPVARTRSITELHRRQAELEATFATAPPDHRRLIDQLTTGQLTLDDLAQTLDQALNAQDQRRQWILKHWPHIVEHAEITRILTTFAHGPDFGPLLDQLAVLDLTHPGSTDAHSLLANGARTDQAWLRVALSHLVPPGADHVIPPDVELLSAIASYRDRWHITHPSPLGLAATSDAQASDLADLARRIDQAGAVSDDLPVAPNHLPNLVQDAPVADLGL